MQPSGRMGARERIKRANSEQEAKALCKEVQQGTYPVMYKQRCQRACDLRCAELVGTTRTTSVERPPSPVDSPTKTPNRRDERAKGKRARN